MDKFRGEIKGRKTDDVNNLESLSAVRRKGGRGLYFVSNIHIRKLIVSNSNITKKHIFA